VDSSCSKEGAKNKVAKDSQNYRKSQGKNSDFKTRPELFKSKFCGLASSRFFIYFPSPNNAHNFLDWSLLLKPETVEAPSLIFYFKEMK